MDNGISIQATTESFSPICSDETDFLIPYIVNAGELGSVSVKYSEKAKKSGFEDNDNLEFDGQSIVLPLPDKLRPDKYEAQLTLHGVSYCGGTQTIDIPFMINYASADVMAQKWDNVIALYNSKYNGGYKFTAQQWYKNGQPIEGETGTYLHLNDATLSPDDVYSVLLTRDDGVQLFTCDFTPTLSARPVPTLYRPRDLIQIVEDEATEVTLVRLNGWVEKHMILSVEEALYAPEEPGVYILNIQTPSEVIKRKIVVR
jgi:hypothetical protein